jgi:hypothetical protein
LIGLQACLYHGLRVCPTSEVLWTRLVAALRCLTAGTAMRLLCACSLVQWRARKGVAAAAQEVCCVVWCGVVCVVWFGVVCARLGPLYAETRLGRCR